MSKDSNRYFLNSIKYFLLNLVFIIAIAIIIAITGCMIYFTIATFQAMFIFKHVLSVLFFAFTLFLSICLIKVTISLIIEVINIFKGDF